MPRKFKMRRKPAKPKPKMVPVSHSIYDGCTGAELQRLLKEAEDAGVELKDVNFWTDSGYGDYDDYYGIRYQRPETDEEYQKRLEQYQKDLYKWKTWYDKNRDKIEKHLAEEELRKQKERDHQQRMEEKEKRARLKRLEKELAALKKEVGE